MSRRPSKERKWETRQRGEDTTSIPPAATQEKPALRLAIGAALAAATIAAYARVLSAEFTYLDDRVYVTENVMVQEGVTWEGIKWALTTVHASNWHPLTWLSHMLDCTLYGLWAPGHHLTSLLLHMANVVLLFHLLCRMTGAVWASAFVAAAFGLHPTHVESVAWVAERKDVLSTFFGLMTLIAYARYVRAGRLDPCLSPCEGEVSTKVASLSRLANYLLVFVMFALSLSAKPMMVTLPFVMLLLDYWPLGRTTSRPPSVSACWRLVAEKIPLFVLAAGSSTVTVFAQRAGGAMMTEAMLSGWARVSNALVSYAKYIGMTIWPTGLAVYYPHPLKPHAPAIVAASTLILLAITATVMVLRRKHPYLLVGWLWFVGTLVPVIGLVQVGGQAMADRYTYMTTIGLFIMAAWAVLGRNLAGRTAPLRVFLAGAVLLALGAGTWVQAGFWKDSMTLFQRAIDVVPDNPQAHIFMANTLIRQGKVTEAVPHFAEAVRIVPNEPYNLTDYGHSLLDAGRPDEAAVQLEAALKLLPTYGHAHYFLGEARLRQGQNAEAVKHLDAALASDPTFLKAHLHLGTAYAAQGKWPLAATHLKKWLEVDPGSVEALTKLAQCYYSLGNASAAQGILQKAVDHNPKNPYPLALMAQMAQWDGQVERAMQAYERALQLDPHYAEAANNLALILATHPDVRLRDGSRAVQLAESAARSREFKDPVTLDTLAAAYAEAGRFADALRTIESAIELARGQSPELVSHLEGRKQLYLAGKPLRSE